MLLKLIKNELKQYNTLSFFAFLINCFMFNQQKIVKKIKVNSIDFSWDNKKL